MPVRELSKTIKCIYNTLTFGCTFVPLSRHRTTQVGHDALAFPKPWSRERNKVRWSLFREINKSQQITFRASGL